MKNLVFVTEARFIKDAQGNIYGDSSFSKYLWERYLTVFKKVYVMARVELDLNCKRGIYERVNSTNVIFIELPYYIGPFGYLKNYRKLKLIIGNNIAALKACCYICRVPGQIGTIAIKLLNTNDIKYALEVVGDPDDVFAPGTIRHPLRSYFRRIMVQEMRNNIKKASAVLYVTKKILQSKYPVSKDIFYTYASNVQLNPQGFVTECKKWKFKTVVTIVSVGSLEQLYKAPDVVLNAINILNNMNLYMSFKLIWVGDGKYMSEMVKLSKSLNISENVIFLGNVDKKEVFKCLKDADIFVLASRTEGLPRAMIEAMSVGLPVVGTNVGGIPELIDESVLIEKNSSKQLADKLFELANNESFFNSQAKKNLAESAEYNETTLMDRRLEFYNYINTYL